MGQVTQVDIFITHSIDFSNKYYKAHVYVLCAVPLNALYWSWKYKLHLNDNLNYKINIISDFIFRTFNVNWDILYLQKFALNLPTSGGRSVGVVSSRTQATEFSY
jgi:hypothetical protein